MTTYNTANTCIHSPKYTPKHPSTNFPTYKEIVTRSANQPIGVLNTGQLRYLAKIPTTKAVDNYISILARASIDCDTCCNRAVKLLPLVGQYPDKQGQNIAIFLFHGADCDIETSKLRDLAVYLFVNYKYQYVEPVLVSANTFPQLEQDGVPHWTVKPDKVTTENITLYERAIDQYVDMKNETKMTWLVKTLLCNRNINILLVQLNTALEKTHNKNSLYRQTTIWMLNIVKFVSNRGHLWNQLSPFDKLEAVMFALETSNLSMNADDNSINCTFYNQSNIIIKGILKNIDNVNTPNISNI